MNIPSAENIYTTKYADFKGVDFTSQICSRQRTPKGKNFIISDMVEKRPGWKILKTFEGEKINGLYFTTINSTEYYLIHTGSKLYYMKSFDEEPVLLLENINNAKSSGFYTNNCYYILTGEEYIEFDGKEAFIINDEMYENPFEVILNTLFKLDADYNIIESYYDVVSNNQFYIPVSGETYKIKDKKVIKNDKSYEIKDVEVNGKTIKNIVDIEGVIYRLSCTVETYYNSYKNNTHLDYFDGDIPVSYEFYPCKLNSSIKLIKTKNTANYYYAKQWGTSVSQETIYNECGMVYDDTLPNLLCGYSFVEYNSYNNISNTQTSDIGYPLPPDARTGKVIIVFKDGQCVLGKASGYHLSDVLYVQTPENFPKSANQQPFKIYYQTNYTNNYIYKSTISSYIQYGNGVYYFFTGNKAHPNRDWQSVLNDPMYIKSDKYTIYGNEDEVLGYGQYGEYLAVFKKGDIDTNIYIRSVTDLGDLGIVFPTSIGVGGAVGGLSSYTIFNMDGETLYLTNQGIFALTSLSLTNMRVTRNRSYFLDGLLLKEKNLENAIACTWKQKYFLCVNSKCYILDGTQSKKYIDSTNNEYSYECLYWDNIPATSFLSTKDKLYFGTEDGKICVFTEGEYYDGEEPTEMVFSTVLDDDGDFMSLKKMKKKGTGILVKPYTKSCFDISFIYDTYAETSVKTAYADIFNFDDVNFDRFTFETSENPRIIPFLKKSKKYKSIQIILKSSKPEPFGILEIVKRFTFNNYVKRS